MSSTFQCQSCFDDKPEEELVLVAGDSVCSECFERGPKSFFIAALKSETNHPAKYGFTVINIDDFTSFFTAEFLAAYHTKLEEYAVAIPERLYCNNKATAANDICGHYLGKKSANSTILCLACSTDVCTECASAISGDLDDHMCSESTVDAFDGQVRGVDYQICPNTSCQIRITLWDGCNHMTCTCNAEFCYRCGKIPEPGHWDEGSGCPHWGRFGDPGAIFDNLPETEEPVLRIIPAPPQHFNDVRTDDQLFATDVIQMLGVHLFQDLPAFQNLSPATLVVIGSIQNHQSVRALTRATSRELSALGEAISDESPHGPLLDLWWEHMQEINDILARQTEPAHPLREQIDELAEALRGELGIYIHDLHHDNRPAFQEQPEHIAARERIHDLGQRVVVVGLGEAFEALEDIAGTYEDAWHGGDILAEPEFSTEGSDDEAWIE